MWKIKTKCVPLAKARSMSEGQRRSAVKRKRSKAQGVGGKPTNVKTILKKNMGGIISDQRRAGVAQRGFGFKGVF
jgi:hypothetical protein